MHHGRLRSVSPTAACDPAHLTGPMSTIALPFARFEIALGVPRYAPEHINRARSIAGWLAHV